MNFNLEVILVLGSALTGAIWLLDLLFLKRKRQEATLLTGAGNRNKHAEEPWYVEYAKSFFPVLVIVLILRSFVAEPFRIPSESMVPTLLKGDFILVNKFEYGIRLPISKAKIYELGEPERGDVVVFRYPLDPAVDYIKRVIGLPGDHIEYFGRDLYVNGVKQPQVPTDETFNDGKVRIEHLGDQKHEILLSPIARNDNIEYRVPPGHYFVMGDNRDNSNDGRVWGPVPEENLVGKAFMIWMNWDWSEGSFGFERIGKVIQ